MIKTDMPGFGLNEAWDYFKLFLQKIKWLPVFIFTTWKMNPILLYEDMVVLSFNPRNHGDSEEGPYPGQELWNRSIISNIAL